MNVHEVTKMRTRLERAGNVAFYAEVLGADDWNRPTVRTAVFLVNVRREDLQRFRAMLKLLGCPPGSPITTSKTGTGTARIGVRVWGVFWVLLQTSYKDC